jgi:hypothetical protein
MSYKSVDYYTNYALQARSPAYCKGFVDGYYEGVENNNFSADDDKLLYKVGYNAGVVTYSRDTHPEE